MRRLLIKSAVFTLMVLALQVAFAVRNQWPDNVAILDFFLKRKAPVVFFGDSTVNWAADNDKNVASTPALMHILMPGVGIAKISYGSYNADVYLSYMKYIVRKGYRPKYIIIPVNLRSFSVEWMMQPIWQFERLRGALDFKDTLLAKFYKPLAIFKFFHPHISRFDYEQSSVFDGKKYVGRAWEFDNPRFKTVTDDNLRRKLIFRHMHELVPEQSRLAALRQTVQLARANGIEPIVYITPIDVEVGVQYLGPDFLRRVAGNSKVVVETLAQDGVQVLDLSCALGTEHFTWREDGLGPYYPNEHLRLMGRMLVAKKLVESTTLKEMVR